MNNIYLCGFMGCGKTTVGKSLAKLTGKVFLDVDDEIVARHGVISDIFAQFGEEHFRRVETSVLEEISKASEGAIISTGGGCVMQPRNVEIMKRYGKLVFLDTPFGHCLARIMGDASRPMAKGGKEEIAALYNKRIGTYTACANITLRPEKTAARTAVRLAKILFPKEYEDIARLEAIYNEYGYYISVPSAMMFAEPCELSECTDEVLYGTRIKLTECTACGQAGSDVDSKFLHCTTSYGYSGYILSSCISKAHPGKHFYSMTVYTPWCDLTAAAGYKTAPLATLPRGACVEYIHDCAEDTRFCRVFYGQKRYFARKECFEATFEKNATTGRRILSAALSYLGTPYRWGGKSPAGIDCSGLAFMAHRLCGIDIFRDAVPDERYVREIAESELAEGDLVYFKGHVAIFAGNGRVVHASATSGKVELTELDRISAPFVCFARAKGID